LYLASLDCAALLPLLRLWSGCCWPLGSSALPCPPLWRRAILPQLLLARLLAQHLATIKGNAITAAKRPSRSWPRPLLLRLLLRRLLLVALMYLLLAVGLLLWPRPPLVHGSLCALLHSAGQLLTAAWTTPLLAAACVVAERLQRGWLLPLAAMCC